MLKIEINSFSFKEGYPEDKSGNGGGFVFDCRGILNPGRIDKYKTQSGLDPEVQKYLNDNTEMNVYLGHIFETIRIPIVNYLERDFSNLQINFGCTGGQHRSVFAAEKTKEFINGEYPQTEVVINHTNTHNWKKD